MIDNVRIGKQRPIGFDGTKKNPNFKLIKLIFWVYKDVNLANGRRLYPSLHVFRNSLNVYANSASKVTVSYRPLNCSYNLQPVSIKQKFSVTSV